MINFIRIRNICHLLDADTTESLCLSLCISHLDYCNAVTIQASNITIHKMQRIQNVCMLSAKKKPKGTAYQHASKQLHWLPICQRISFKLLVLTHKCLHGDGPAYLIELLQYKTILRKGTKIKHSQRWLTTKYTKNKVQNICQLVLQCGSPHLCRTPYPTTSGVSSQYLHLRKMVKNTSLPRGIPRVKHLGVVSILAVSMFFHSGEHW